MKKIFVPWKMLVTTLLLPLILFEVSAQGKHSPQTTHISLEGKMLCGYQGWFSADGDGSGYYWKHYTKNDSTISPVKPRFQPGFSTIDLWPDMEEMDDDEKYNTAFCHADGSVATTFSSYHPKTVNRHYRWMEEYGIDGTVNQRFVTGIRTDNASQTRLRDFNDKVLKNAIIGAQNHNRMMTIMYDMSGMIHEDVNTIINDWKHLVDDLQVTSQNPNPYLHHNGKPLICLWGIGFSDIKNRKFSYEDVNTIIDFFQNDPVYGGCSTLLGVPFFWRYLKADAQDNDSLHQVIKQADFITPWAVSRFDHIKYIHDEQMSRDNGNIKCTYSELLKLDLTWCQENGVGYIPGVWPGFSWRYHSTINTAEWSEFRNNPIQRLKGDFIWAMANSAIQNGVKTLYGCMFDEIDEGTALFKCSNNPPVNQWDRFLTYEDMPSDHYLWIVGELTRILRGEAPNNSSIPIRADTYQITATVTLQPLGKESVKLTQNGLANGHKLYVSNAYVVPYGAPTLQSYPNEKYFATILESELTLNCPPGKYLSIVETDQHEHVTGYLALQAPIDVDSRIHSGKRDPFRVSCLESGILLSKEYDSRQDCRVRLYDMYGQLIHATTWPQDQTTLLLSDITIKQFILVHIESTSGIIIKKLLTL